MFLVIIIIIIIVINVLVLVLVTVLLLACFVASNNCRRNYAGIVFHVRLEARYCHKTPLMETWHAGSMPGTRKTQQANHVVCHVLLCKLAADVLGIIVSV